jgi:hypothetical protein
VVNLSQYVYQAGKSFFCRAVSEMLHDITSGQVFVYFFQKRLGKDRKRKTVIITLRFCLSVIFMQ